jgi:hypothetical protein
VAEFRRETAKIQEVYFRRVFAGGVEKYERQPYNLIEYDDNSGMYIQPRSDGTGLSGYTWGDANSTATIGSILILDSGEPWAGITEIR